ncbi:type VII secretion-associated serine protease [Longispora fulva]|uniref:Type VII secretion-associated serine protease mycosin n=1 Tax=Longispora fulva TaxID=619741 RepID=A0A8J7GRW9_9ACTN|nr:type VII secretion-associated serine protease mycosin [Longispora fulva]MBG6135871.1 type VII secretion-associated serine protease mycosin [Longispora fulva]GIG55885.1 type VII secretion-associated serine protease [Longispora fulva]
MSRLHALPIAVALLAVAVASPAAAAPPPGACHDPEGPHARIQQVPWAQQTLDPRRAWPYSRGAGVLVAVIDSGVDADHPQLRRPGKVRPGRDFHLPGALPGAFDCVSHGTAVASIIGADPVPDVGFHGVAPDAELLAVRISDRDVGDRGELLRINPQAVADGIRYAADQGARVINLSLAGQSDFPAIREAVAYAVARDALVVAAAGNAQRDAGELPSFPAGYDGVLGVGAVDINGARLPDSQIGGYVGLVAPGAKVVGATRVDGHAYLDGTSFAAPFVAGTAALVRAAWPALSAPEVARRLKATASPARGGRDSRAFGAGLVDPYRAVTDGLDLARPTTRPGYVARPPDQARLDREARDRHVLTTARGLAGVAGGTGALVAVLAAVFARGRRRGWRPGWAVPPVVDRRSGG